MSYNDWEAVIGLEIHAQLRTKSKMFSPDPTDFGSADNENTHPISMGMPGTLPVVNARAIEYSVMTGLALNCEIRKKSVFARKNYFYPDLPKGYQISQFDEPLCEKGHVEFVVDGARKRIGITRAHMEEDAGKSTHHGDYTQVNFNRAGIPLLEIVSEPELRTPAEAAEYARTIRKILRYLDVCDGNLEEGSMRCDCNISVRRKGTIPFGTKVEIKNINSFRFIEKALEYEIERQIEAVESGEKIQQETRLFDSTKNRTNVMRSKEEAHDYRYFPDPDLLPVQIEAEWLANIRQKLPELPLARVDRFTSQYQLPEYDALILTEDRELADFFETVSKECQNPKAASNWIMVEVLRELKDANLTIQACPIQPTQLAQLIALIDKGAISGKMAKSVFAEMWKTQKNPEELVASMGLVQISNEGELEAIISEIVAANPGQVQQYQSGKDKLFGFFVGQVMKATKGQANPDVVNRILKEKLKG